MIIKANGILTFWGEWQQEAIFPGQVCDGQVGAIGWTGTDLSLYTWTDIWTLRLIAA